MTNPSPVLCSTLAGVSATLCLSTLTVPQWIERTAGFSPDRGDGSTEWEVALSCLAASVIFLAVARRSRRRVHVSATPPLPAPASARTD